MLYVLSVDTGGTVTYSSVDLVHNIFVSLVRLVCNKYYFEL